MMSRSIVRRLTAAIALLAVLGFALPASAAAHPRAAKTPAVTSSGLVDQLLIWLGSLWSGQPAETQGQTGLTKTLVGSPTPGTSSLPLANADRGGMIDPNGGS
jgi:hypothetical protein